MATTETYHKYIIVNSKGVPIIKGTRTKVIELAEEKLAWGWDAEEIHHQHPYLTLEQTRAAMDYYADHREEMDQEIAKEIETYEKMRRDAGPSLIVEKLKAKGLL